MTQDFLGTFLLSLVLKYDNSSSFEILILESPYLRDITDKMGGVLALTWSAEQSTGELLWGHTTETMALGYMQVNSKPKFKLSSLPTGKVPGRSLLVEGITFNFVPI